MPVYTGDRSGPAVVENVSSGNSWLACRTAPAPDRGRLIPHILPLPHEHPESTLKACRQLRWTPLVGSSALLVMIPKKLDI